MDTTFRLPRFRGQTQVSRPQQDGGEGRGRIAGGRPAQLSLLHRQLNCHRHSRRFQWRHRWRQTPLSGPRRMQVMLACISGADIPDCP